MNERMNDIDFAMMRAAADYIKKRQPPEEWKRQHPDWNFEALKNLGVGTVDSFKNFKEYIKNNCTKKGATIPRLRDAGLLNSKLFSPKNVIFVLYDIHNIPIGFVGRVAEHESPAQWIPWTGPHYNREEYLYGLRGAAMSDKEFVYIVAGYSDSTCMRVNGIENVVALGSNAFSFRQLETMKREGIKNLVLAIDNNEEGKKTLDNILDLIIRINGIHKLSILCIPNEYTNVTQFLDANTPKQLQNLDRMSPFSWYIRQFSEEDLKANPIDAVTRTIPYLLLEPNRIQRGQMAEVLAEMFRLPVDRVMEEVDRQDAVHNAALEDQIESIKENMARRIRRMTPEQFAGELYEAHRAVNSIVCTKTRQTEVKTIDAVEAYLKKWREKTTEIDGLQTFCGQLTKALNGIPRAGKCIYVGGGANVGKTALLQSMSVGMLRANDEDLKILHFTLDDDKETTVARYIANISGLKINDIRNPTWRLSLKQADGRPKKDEYGHPIPDPTKTTFLLPAIDEFKTWVATGMLEIYESSDGNTLQYIESKAHSYRKSHPDKTIIIIVDNFHDLADYPAQEERIRFKKIAQDQKEIANRERCTFISSAELTKEARGNEPTGKSLAETAKLDYKSDATLLLYSDLHEKREKATVYWTGGAMTEDVYNNRRPAIKLIFDKNKISGWKGFLYYKLNHESSAYEVVEPANWEEQLFHGATR